MWNNNKQTIWYTQLGVPTYARHTLEHPSLWIQSPYDKESVSSFEYQAPGYTIKRDVCRLTATIFMILL